MMNNTIAQARAANLQRTATEYEVLNIRHLAALEMLGEKEEELEELRAAREVAA